MRAQALPGGGLRLPASPDRFRPSAPSDFARLAQMLDTLPDVARTERVARGRSIRQAAEEAGIHFSNLDRFERGNGWLSRPNLARLLLWLDRKPGGER